MQAEAGQIGPAPSRDGSADLHDASRCCCLLLGADSFEPEDGLYVTGLRRGHAPKYRNTLEAASFDSCRAEPCLRDLMLGGPECFGISKLPPGSQV